MKKVIIVVPVYKDSMNINEEQSFNRLTSVLSSYEICIVTYKQLDISLYLKKLKECGVKYNVEYFHQAYFKGVYSYNFLALSKCFYKRFRDYNYMYIYQLDVYAFRDELLKWCEEGYDYIGAPVFEKKRYDFEKNMYYNGGASLRNIEHFLKAYNVNWLVIYVKLISRYLPSNPILRFVKQIITLIHGIMAMMSVPFPLSWFKAPHEDILWSSIPTFTYPNEAEAASFAFEKNPSDMFLKYKKLPFCCHAWQKFEYNEFWKKYIQVKKLTDKQ